MLSKARGATVVHSKEMARTGTNESEYRSMNSPVSRSDGDVVSRSVSPQRINVHINAKQEAKPCVFLVP